MGSLEATSALFFAVFMIVFWRFLSAVLGD